MPGETQKQLVVVALGGNALLRQDEPLNMESQAKNARIAAQALAKLMQEGYQLCITHGNGPQVGVLAELDPHTPLDVLGAESQGQLAYLLATQLGNVLGPGQQLASVLTRVRVDPADGAFKSPTKGIGAHYQKGEADKLKEEKGWTFKEKDGKWRRVVPSPDPIEIMEADSIRLLQENGVTVISCGGGGIPVAYEAAEQQQGQEQQGAQKQDGGGNSESCKQQQQQGSGSTLKGVEAVIDKDAASSLLARQIKASALLMLTDVEAVWDPDKEDEKTPLPSPLRARDLEGRRFAEGSMGPKIKAALDFVGDTGGVAGIGALEDALAVLRGEKGTLIVPDDWKQ